MKLACLTIACFKPISHVCTQAMQKSVFWPHGRKRERASLTPHFAEACTHNTCLSIMCKPTLSAVSAQGLLNISYLFVEVVEHVKQGVSVEIHIADQIYYMLLQK